MNAGSQCFLFPELTSSFIRHLFFPLESICARSDFLSALIFHVPFRGSVVDTHDYTAGLWLIIMEHSYFRIFLSNFPVSPYLRRILKCRLKPGIHLSKNNRAPRRGSLGAPRCVNVYGQLRCGKQPRFASARCATWAVGCRSIKVSTGRGVPHSCAVVFAQVYSRLKWRGTYPRLLTSPIGLLLACRPMNLLSFRLCC